MGGGGGGGGCGRGRAGDTLHAAKFKELGLVSKRKKKKRKSELK